MKLLLTFLTSISLLVACSEKQMSDLELMQRYFENHHNVKLGQFNTLIVLTDEGCLNCNKSLALNTIPYINHDSILFYVSASGLRYNISDFIYNPAPNVIIESESEIEKPEILNSTKVVFYRSSHIDTIIPLSGDQLRSQLDEILSRIQGQ